MSGPYLVGVIVLWLWVTFLLWKGSLFRISRASERLRGSKWIVSAILLLWFGASFWYGGGQKFYYDWRIDRMCAVDGGVKVHEVIRLPIDKFDELGMVNFYRPNLGEDSLGKDYSFNREVIYYSRGNPELFKVRTQVIRVVDCKVLGESVFYKRVGGDLPGPWHGSSYLCPELNIENDVLRQIFVKE